MVSMSKRQSRRRFGPTDLLLDLDGVANILHPSPSPSWVSGELDGYVLHGDPVVLDELGRVIAAYHLRPT